MSVYVVSDTHLFHANIIKYCNRPFADANEMNEVIIRNWNSVVGVDDVIYHLGDVVLAGKDRLEDTIKLLNGRKVLVRGNHDRDISDGRFIRAGFVAVHSAPVELIVEGTKVVLSHAPIAVQEDFVNIHGHIHNSNPFPKYDFYSLETHKCVSVEMTHYRPILIEDALEGREITIPRDWLY